MLWVFPDSPEVKPTSWLQLSLVTSSHAPCSLHPDPFSKYLTVALYAPTTWPCWPSSVPGGSVLASGPWLWLYWRGWEWGETEPLSLGKTQGSGRDLAVTDLNLIFSYYSEAMGSSSPPPGNSNVGMMMELHHRLFVNWDAVGKMLSKGL